MKIAVGCDNAAAALKVELVRFAESFGHTCVDCGVFEGEPNDYPIYAARAARLVRDGKCERGLVLCGTGVGTSLAANKIRGIRCALCGDCYTAMMSRAHNDANMLSLGARVLGVELAKEILRIWLETGFDGGRHARRVAMFQKLEGDEPIE